jgi:N-carbamoylputrescine amidase
MKITVCQLEPRPDSLDEQLVALADHVAANRSDFVLLPEMPFSEWLAADPDPDSERWLAGVKAHDERIGRLAELGVRNVAGTRPIVNGVGSHRNQAFLWTQPSGTAAGVREKYYLPDEEGYWEHSWYDRGALEFGTARAGDAVLGFQICTELWFLEWARHYASSRVDLLCVPRATPRGSTEKWIAGGQAAAICSGAYCVSSNQWTEARSGADCGGIGWVIDPDGVVLATTSQDRPFATIEVDLDFSRRSKSTYPRYVPE